MIVVAPVRPVRDGWQEVVVGNSRCCSTEHVFDGPRKESRFSALGVAAMLDMASEMRWTSGVWTNEFATLLFRCYGALGRACFRHA